MNCLRHLFVMGAVALCTLPVFADNDAAIDSVNISGRLIGGGATRQFNPYFLGSNNYGKHVTGATAAIEAEVVKPVNRDRRFSWEAGADVLTGYNGAVHYMRYEANNEWAVNRQRQSAFTLQQLWAGVKFRGVELWAGMRQQGSFLVNDVLSSGDLVHSANARPIAQVSAGFIDFQNIPFTGGWAQIDGAISYGKMADGDWLSDRTNRYNGHVTTGTLYTYKRVSFRSNPNKSFYITIGAQCAGFFGGTTHYYDKGVQTREVKNRQNLKAFWEMLIPAKDNGDDYVEGSSLGSWDFKATYNLQAHHAFSGYFQWLWEDGSSMGKRNKWDGLWGIEYKNLKTTGVTLLRGAVVEYIDFRDQSGPIHWAPGDSPGTDITTEATGGDDYYNNHSYNSYANYGMSLGTPFVLSPIYNTNGCMQFLHTRSRGVHIAAEGDLSNSVTWCAKFGHAVAWGRGRLHFNDALHNTSALVQVVYRPKWLLEGLQTGAALSFDAGSLRGNNWGGMVTISYDYSCLLKK